MKTTLIVVSTSALSALVAYQVGLWRQNTKDAKIFGTAMSAVEAILRAETSEQVEDVLTTFQMDLNEF